MASTPLTLPLQLLKSVHLNSTPELVDEDQILQRIRVLVDFLDNRYVIPGTNLRFGWDGLIGLIPGVGDVVTTGIAAYLVVLARQLGVPKRMMLRMAANVCMDMGLGAVPVVGNLFDVAFRANVRNLRLLERHLLSKQRAARKVA